MHLSIVFESATYCNIEVSVPEINGKDLEFAMKAVKHKLVEDSFSTEDSSKWNITTFKLDAKSDYLRFSTKEYLLSGKLENLHNVVDLALKQWLNKLIELENLAAFIKDVSL